ncbi:MAG: TIGR03118 family protein, partial [Candidatus Acidiferrales bacterium]
GFASHLNPFLQNPWGIAFQPGQPFFIANTNNGRVIAYDASGSNIGLSTFRVPNAGLTGPDFPTGVVSDSNSLFGTSDLVQPFIVVTENGGIFAWGADVNGGFPQDATLMVDNSQSGAVYTALAILTPACCAPFLAVANFHTGLVEMYSTHIAPLGSFADPSLPPGYAPYGMQVIGNQVFIASALQDGAKHDPVPGEGNGVVSVFDFQGRFLRQLAAAGSLNAPWGVAQAGANFGPMSNHILISNSGDGTISAFDPVTGDFAGQLMNGGGKALVNSGIHALTFRSDNFGDPDTLYLTAGINDGQDGLFAAISTGLVSVTDVSAPATPANSNVTITATVAAGPANTGNPTGTVVNQDGSNVLGTVPLINGVAALQTQLSGVGIHELTANYGGDAVFLASLSTTEVTVTGAVTTTTLTAPSNATPATSVLLRAAISTQVGTPMGIVEFLDSLSGNSHVIGQAAIDASGTAALNVHLAELGSHSLIAHFEGNESLAASDSAPVTIVLDNGDFAVVVAPPAATITAGQSATFSVTITSAEGFADLVTFSCPVVTGITCSFNPPMLTPNGEGATTLLTVTTSADVPRFGQTFGTTGSGLLLASLGLVGILASQKKSKMKYHAAFLRTAAFALAIFPLLVLVSCGGGSTASAPASRGTASIVVTAQSGAVTHTATVHVTVQ